MFVCVQSFKIWVFFLHVIINKLSSKSNFFVCLSDIDYMGCANSKEKKRCISHYSPVPRTNSMHVLHPPQTKEDNYNVVALKSTTLGSLDEVSHQNYDSNGCIKFPNGDRLSYSDFFGSQNLGLRKENSIDDVAEEAKEWSNMIEQKLPKAIVVPMTPTMTPPCEPETINTWELMEGLEDISPLWSPIHFKSFSFDVNYNHVVEVDPHRCSFMENGTTSNKPFSDFDDDLVSSLLRKALEEKEESLAVKGLSFEEKKINGDDDRVAVMDFKSCRKVKDKVVLYFTTLRGVRKTYEDCYHVRMILKGLGVKVDERDVSMHSGFKEELKELLGDGLSKGRLLPRVFVERNYIGGADEIQKMHEDGKLDKLFDCCEKIDANDALCEACGDIRFVPCETCNGSCKIYYDDNDEEKEAEDGEMGEYGFQRCPDCNENGLIRCPICCY
ncbi:PREDICTED: uncharacterized protein At3g28850-like isoform X2 [Lupinus angustifolius]|uniref:uncharacterized protein At3g28850-like isoform X2 n=1 Tax=Lupinus angustifolius TaxID=3871 RepID=UPI00092FD882|nr:PREDICTED: uncharacterized protein At3g28850-like isoform X2 [Lupinus angustifolius]